MRIHKEECTGVVIDIQEKLLPVMEHKEKLLERCIILLKGLQILEIPLLITEQYPKGLGPTVEPVRSLFPEFKPIEKMSFSCCDEPAYLMALEQSARRKVIICGIESHVCVLQTVIDLLGAGHMPVVVSDCTSSRNREDKTVAMERMRMEGAVITTSESILFELARISGNDTFKDISRLVK